MRCKVSIGFPHEFLAVPALVEGSDLSEIHPDLFELLVLLVFCPPLVRIGSFGCIEKEDEKHDDQESGKDF